MKNLILYGTLTGNTEIVAQQIQDLVQQAGKEIVVKNVNDASEADLKQVKNLLVVAASTWDDGLPCADMVSFLEDYELPDLSGKKLAIFCCGDSNYQKFCGAVGILEDKFTKAGAKKVIDSLKIDGFIEGEDNQQKIKDFAKKLSQLL